MERNKIQKIYKVIMLVMIVIVITSLVTAYATYNYLKNEKLASDGKTTNNISGLEYTLARFRSELEKKYLGEINDQDLIDGAIKGYVAGLGDPYTTYYTEKEMKEIRQETNGNFVGIGVYMMFNTEKNAIEVIKPIEDSPAEKAGILQGDFITKVDGKSYTGEQMDEAANNIKGKAGTKVKIEIVRDGKTKEFEITRQKVFISHITSKS